MVDLAVLQKNNINKMCIENYPRGILNHSISGGFFMQNRKEQMEYFLTRY